MITKGEKASVARRARTKYVREAKEAPNSIRDLSSRVAQNENPELYQYYYHADHLGSSSYITDLNGEVAQHIEYVPFGEVFIEERNNTWNTPYLFNGKELDEETGLYYYGARYYNPRVSQWLSVDPPMLNGQYLDGQLNAGVYNSGNLGIYNYTYQNPIKYEDPNGNCPQCFTGAVVGALTEIVAKVGYDMVVNGSDFSKALANLATKESAIDIAVAAGTGAIAGAVDGGMSRAASFFSKSRNRKILKIMAEKGIDFVIETVENLSKDYFKGEDINLKEAIIGALVEVGVGELLPNTKSFKKNADNAKIKLQRNRELIERGLKDSKYQVRLDKAKAEVNLNQTINNTFNIIEGAIGEASGNYSTRKESTNQSKDEKE